jgi:N-acetylmuramoyl-L-alanine amidase
MLLMLLPLWSFSAVSVTGLHRDSNAQSITYRVTATGAFEYHQQWLSRPARLVLDFKNVRWQAKLPSSMTRPYQWLRAIRVGQHGHHWRLVFELSRKVPVSLRWEKNTLLIRFSSTVGRTAFDRERAVASLKQHLEKKLVKQAKTWFSDLGDSARKKSSTDSQPQAMPASKKKQLASAAPVSVPLKLRDVVVVVDPGHGGKDPGAIGRLGTREKDVVLLIAKALQKKINQQPGFRAILTRRDDRYVSLRQRLAIARAHKADMFISVHADAFKNRKAHGASVYALSQRGATSEAARWLATRENRSELMGGVDLSDKGRMLKSILLDLSQTATISASLEIGGDILQALGRVGSLHHKVVEQAAFVVLKSPDIPSLLVETGFISNRQEEFHLRSPRYRAQVAGAIMQGISRYFVSHPPRNSWLAYYRKNRSYRYTVHRGDSLSQIAERFRVDTAQLKKLNQLKSNQIRVGQVLLIPKARVG